MAAVLEVHYKKEGSKQIISTGNKALGDIIIDSEGIPEEERNGTAKQLFGAANLICYCGSLVSAMEARDFEYTGISAKAILTTGNNSNNVARILDIELQVTVDFNKDDYDTFERIKKVMKNGCLLTSSIHDGVHMNYNLIAACDKE